MPTFENQTIRVTVTDEVVENYSSKVAHVSRISGATPEQTLRGLIISQAMSIIGNRSEADILATEINEPISEQDIRALATEILIAEYLNEHTKYRPGETLRRMMSGMLMSEGMQHEADMAQSYARGALNPLTTNEITEQMQANLENRREQQKIVLAARPNLSVGAHAIQAAHDSLLRDRTNELQHRRARSAFPSWEIEIIGKLPNQIGLCRVEA